jgi:hypothetical protein
MVISFTLTLGTATSTSYHVAWRKPYTPNHQRVNKSHFLRFE